MEWMWDLIPFKDIRRVVWEHLVKRREHVSRGKLYNVQNVDVWLYLCCRNPSRTWQWLSSWCELFLLFSSEDEREGGKSDSRSSFFFCCFQQIQAVKRHCAWHSESDEMGHEHAPFNWMRETVRFTRPWRGRRFHVALCVCMDLLLPVCPYSQTAWSHLSKSLLLDDCSRPWMLDLTHKPKPAINWVFR